MGVYARFAPDFIAAGLPVFPVNTREKRPAVKGWQDTTARHARAWANNPSLSDADGIGLLMGERSGITEIDVDAVGDAWVGAALDRFGETPIIIRTANGKAKLWYRHNGEGRHIRPFAGEPIDILGAGFTVAPPSYRLDLGAGYEFRAGGLDHIHRLPVIRNPETGFQRAAQGVRRGERNNTLYAYCMTQATSCDDLEALIDVALTWNSAFPDPLPTAEAKAVAGSAWGYEINDKNFVGLKKPQVTIGDKIMDDLLTDHSDAFGLYQYLWRWHHNRPRFAISPQAMSDAGSPGWHRKRIARARDVLLERGHIILVCPAIKGHRAAQYRFAARSENAHNHYTPSPPPLAGVLGVQP